MCDSGGWKADDGAIYPDLAKSPDGGAALAWLSAGGVLLGEVSPEGDLATPARLLNVPDDAGPPRVAQTASGPIVAWDDIGPVSREIYLSDGAPSKMAAPPSPAPPLDDFRRLPMLVQDPLDAIDEFGKRVGHYSTVDF